MRETQMVVGCFTTPERNAHGSGLSVFRRTAESWDRVAHLGGIVNPSVVCVDRRRSVVYTSHADADVAGAYRIDPASGAITRLGEVDAGGLNGVAAALHPSGEFLFIAHFTSGTVTTLPIDADGGLRDATHRFELPGRTGTHEVTHPTPQPHDVVMDPSGRFLLVPDRGLGRVVVLRPDGETGELSLVGTAALRPRSGSRHIAFHPTSAYAYVVCEIDGTVATLAWDAATGALTPTAIFPELPESFFGHNTAAEIVVDPSGRFLYVSNRGADVITRFAIDRSGARLELLGHTPSGGRIPRHMALTPDGEHLVVANEQSDSIVEFAIDGSNGELHERGTVATATPSALGFL